ncbi:MAG: aspartate/glutamate racemase family protein, partial [Polyangiaceae bacterium]
MLETRFPRVLGDAGNPETWPFEVDLEIVRGIGVDAAVRGAKIPGRDDLFIDAARRLEQRGASLITTSCGFLILFQAALQAAIRVPVVTSSLLAVPLLASVLD